MKHIDKYILKSLLQTFIFGIIVFAAVLLASEAFLDAIRQIAKYDIPFDLAILAVTLKLPYIIVYTIPMALLVSVILTYNRLNNNLEITAIRASGVSLYRLIIPALIIGVFATIFTLFLNEVVVPKANYHSRNIMLWAIIQKNISEDKENFTYKELGKNNKLKRLFYINKHKNGKFLNVIVIDQTDLKTTKIIQSKEVISKPEKWIFNNGNAYTVSSNGKLSNKTSFKTITIEDPIKIDIKRSDPRSKEHNFFELAKIIKKDQETKNSVETSLVIKWYEKLSIPFSCILVALIGMPLALSPPRSKINRGMGFSIIAIFTYYLLRSITTSLGEIHILTPLLAAWLPNILILIFGIYLLNRKNYC